jgi:hypothetical protein
LHSEIIAACLENTKKRTKKIYRQNAGILLLTQAICPVNRSFMVLRLSHMVKMDNANLIANFTVDREHPAIKAKVLVLHKYYIPYGGPSTSKLPLNLPLRLKISVEFV